MCLWVEFKKTYLTDVPRTCWEVVWQLAVSCDNLLDYNVYHPKIVVNHGSFIPLKYWLLDLITQHVQENNHLFYDLWSIYHPRAWSRNSNKKVNLLVFFKSVNFSNDSFRNGFLKYGSFIPQIRYCSLQL